MSCVRWHCVILYGRWRSVALRWVFYKELYTRRLPIPPPLLPTTATVDLWRTQIMNISLSRGYNELSFREDLKVLYNRLGLENRRIVFMFGDQHVAEDGTQPKEAQIPLRRFSRDISAMTRVTGMSQWSRYNGIWAICSCRPPQPTTPRVGWKSLGGWAGRMLWFSDEQLHISGRDDYEYSNF